MHILFHLDSEEQFPSEFSEEHDESPTEVLLPNEDELTPTDEISNKALEAAIDFVEVCCQHAAYITGHGKMDEELKLIETGKINYSISQYINCLCLTGAATPRMSGTTCKSPKISNESMVLCLPGKTIDVSYIVNVKKKFRGKCGVEGVVAAMKNLEADGLGKLSVKNKKFKVIKHCSLDNIIN